MTAPPDPSRPAPDRAPTTTPTPSGVTDRPPTHASHQDRCGDLAYKANQLRTTRGDLERVLAADVVVGDALSWGGELVDVTSVERLDDDAVEIYGRRHGWTFPLEFLPFEVVSVRHEGVDP